MSIVRWEPMRDMAALQSDMNRLFSTFFEQPSGGGNMRRWVPAMDLAEHEDHFELTADLPGIEPDDVEIEVEDRVLTVRGERKHEQREEKAGMLRVERATGAFHRALTLPEGVNADEVSASFDKGVLTVRIPKPEERKPHRVQISSAGEAPRTLEGSAS